MPVSRDEAADAADGPRSLAPDSDARRLLDFLVEHPDGSFTPGELADGTGVDRDRVEPSLSWLAEMGVAEREGGKWVVGPDDRRAVLGGMLHASKVIDERYPAPDKEEWMEYAEEREHASEDHEQGTSFAERYPAPNYEEWVENAEESPDKV